MSAARESEEKGPRKTWRYHVRTPHGWAVIYIESTGLFTANSDWGAFGYFWSHPGCTIREFIAEMGERGAHGKNTYLLSKLARKEYCGEATRQGIREDICQGRRCGELTRELAREYFDEVDDYDFDSESGFDRWLRDSVYAEFRGEAWELCRQGYPGQALGFCQHVMPELAKQIRAELAKEAA